MQAVEPERVQFSELEKLIPMSLFVTFVRSLSIFQMWMIMSLPLLAALRSFTVLVKSVSQIIDIFQHFFIAFKTIQTAVVQKR